MKEAVDRVMDNFLVLFLALVALKLALVVLCCFVVFLFFFSSRFWQTSPFFFSGLGISLHLSSTSQLFAWKQKPQREKWAEDQSPRRICLADSRWGPLSCSRSPSHFVSSCVFMSVCAPQGCPFTLEIRHHERELCTTTSSLEQLPP